MVWQISCVQKLLTSPDQSITFLVVIELGADPLREFMRTTVPSYEELELLLLMRRESARTWSPAEVGAALALTADTALAALRGLRERGILKSRARRGVVRFRFAPKTDELRGQIAKLARLYALDRALVAEVMSMNSFERLRAAAAHSFATMLAVGARGRRSD